MFKVIELCSRQPADLCPIVFLYMHDLTLIPPTESRTAQWIFSAEGGSQAILRLVSSDRVDSRVRILLRPYNQFILDQTRCRPSLLQGSAFLVPRKIRSLA